MCKPASRECRRKHPSLLSRHNFGEQVLHIFLTKIMAAIFDFNGSRRLGREKNLFKGVVDCQNEKGGGGEEKILTLSLPPTPNRPL